jgi:hypothetical protein
MSVQDDKVAGQDDHQQATEKNDRQAKDDPQAKDEQQATEKPEPGEGAKRKAAEMMTAYEDRPTLVLPGSGGKVSGTAVNDWLDEEGNPKSEIPDHAGSEAKASAEEARNDEAKKEQIEKDKALNEELKKVAAEVNKGEKRSTKR